MAPDSRAGDGPPLHLPEERPGRAAPSDLKARRDAMAAALAGGAWRTDIPAVEEIWGGVRALRFASPAPARGSVVHLHGGGYRLGCPEMAGPFAAALAARCRVDVVCPAYRLAPEHTFPGGLIDAYGVTRALVETGTDKLIVSGDSAGGGLAAAVAALGAADDVALAGLVLLSAWLDLTVSSSCYEANAATDALFSRAAAQEAADLYLQGWSAFDPLASPLFASPAGFPPAFISVGTGEVLADDSRRFHAALTAAGATSDLHEIEGMEHTAVVRGFDLPGAAQTFDRLAAFVDRILDPRL